MILSCSNISKAFGTEEILKHVSFHVEDHEKAAIVGINGAGKSTLLKIIVGELAADEGSVTIAKGKTLGYLAQHQDLHSQTTIYDSLLEVKRPILEMEQQIRTLELQMKHAEGEKLETMLNTYSRLNHEFELLNGYAWQSEITGVLKGLGFVEEEFSKPVSELSGGQKTRVSLGKLLLSKPDIILLDEPTNHLDMESIAWLETYLMNYAGTVIIVAHDRYFLDRVVTKIVELDGGIATSFQGNYTAYSEKKAIIRAGVLKAYLNQQQEIRHQEEVITKLKSFNREKSIKRAESREKMLSKMDLLEKPTEINDAMHITLEPCVTSGNDVLSVRELAKSFDGMTLFTDLNFEVKRGERIAIIGNNGTGKTTILKMINGLLTPDNGEIRLGSKVHIGYYDQEHQVLHMDKTLFQEIQDTYPNMNNTQIRNTLAAFLFTGDDVFKLIRDYDAVLGTAHVSPKEAFVVVEAARDAGVKKIVITHPEWWVVDMSIDDQIRLVRDYDVILERCYAQNMGGGAYKSNLPDNLELIKAVGYEHVMVDTDGGQTENPHWELALEEYMQYLADHGIPEEHIYHMTRTIPYRLLGIEE